MSVILEKYGRFGLDAATAATTVSFAAAKAATKMGVRRLSFSLTQILSPCIPYRSPLVVV